MKPKHLGAAGHQPSLSDWRVKKPFSAVVQHFIMYYVWFWSISGGFEAYAGLKVGLFYKLSYILN